MAQTARPDSDITTSTWTTTPLYSKINDASDGTEITSNNGNETYFEVGLDDLSYPDTGDCILYVRWNSNGNGNEEGSFYLYEGTTLRASYGPVVPGTTLTTSSYTLTTGERDAITDWTNLRARVEAIDLGPNDSLDVADVWFVTPDAGTPIVPGAAAITAKAGVTAAGAQMTHLGVSAITAKAGVTAAGTTPFGTEIDSGFTFPHDNATSCLAWNRLGPFCDANENLYVIGINHSDGKPEIWKYNGSTWAQQDVSETFTIDMNGGEGLSACLISNQLLMVTEVGAVLYFYRFGLSNYPSTPDTWLEKETVIATYTSTGYEAAASVAATSDAKWIILSSGEDDATFEHVEYHYNTGSGWTTKQNFCDSGSYDNNAGTIGVAPWGDVVGWWKRDDTDYASVRWATDVDQTFSSQLDVADFYTGPPNFPAPSNPPVCYESGANEVIVWICTDDDADPYGYLRSTYIVNGTPASSTQIGDVYVKMCPSDAGSPHQAGVAAAADGTDVYVMMVSESDENVYVVKNSDNGGWGSKTLVGGSGTCERLAGEIYERDGWVKFGIVFEKAPGGPINFYEYDIRAATTVVTGSAAIAAKAGVTAAGSVEVQAGTTGVTAKAATSASALLEVLAALGITAKGSVSASGIAFAIVTGDAAIAAQASTTAQGVLEVMATLGIEARASMTPVGWLEVLGGSQIAAQAGVSADALDIVLAALAIAAEAGMVVSGDVVSSIVYGDASIVAATGVTSAGLWGEVSPWCDWVYETTLAGGGIVTGAAAMAARAALTSSAYLEIPGVVAITAKGAVGGTGYLFIPGASQIGAASAVAVSGLQQIFASSNIQAAAGLSASGLQEVLAAAAIAGQGGLSVAALLEVLGYASMTAEAGLSVSALRMVLGSSSVAGQAGLSVSALLQVLGDSAIAAAAGVDVSGLLQALGSSTISAAAAVGSDSYLIIPGSAAIEASALLAAVAEVLGFSVISGSASIGAEASLAAGAYLITAGSADVQALGGVTVDGLLEILADLAINAAAGVDPGTAILIRPGAADIQAAAAIVASGEYEILAQALIQPAAGVSSDAYLFVYAQAEVDGKLRVVAIPTQWVEMVIKRIHSYRGI